jgi:hypothetical protein
MNLWVSERKGDFLTGYYSVKFAHIGKSCKGKGKSVLLQARGAQKVPGS